MQDISKHIARNTSMSSIEANKVHQNRHIVSEKYDHSPREDSSILRLRLSQCYETAPPPSHIRAAKITKTTQSNERLFPSRIVAVSPLFRRSSAKLAFYSPHTTAANPPAQPCKLASGTRRRTTKNSAVRPHNNRYCCRGDQLEAP